MKREIFKDERLTMEKQKITSEAFSLVMVFLLGPALVKQFVFEAPFAAYAVEFMAFFGGCWYLVIRNLFVGNTIFGEPSGTKNPIPFLSVLVIGVSVAWTTTFLNYQDFKGPADLVVTLVVSFLTSSFAVSIVYFVTDKIAKKRTATLEKKLDEDDL